MVTKRRGNHLYHKGLLPSFPLFVPEGPASALLSTEVESKSHRSQLSNFLPLAAPSVCSIQHNLGDYVITSLGGCDPPFFSLKSKSHPTATV